MDHTMVAIFVAVRIVVLSPLQNDKMVCRYGKVIIWMNAKAT